MPRCPHCEARVAPGARVCPECNERIGKSGGKSKKSGGNPLMIILVIVGVVFGVGALACGGFVLFVGLSLQPAIKQARNAAQNAQSRNNLKQIGLALHNYHDIHRSFPYGGTFSEDGAGHHGWMTALLPLVDQAPLYSRIDMNEPWNAPKNQSAFRSLVPVYRHPTSRNGGTTEGLFATTDYSANSLLFGKNKQFAIRDLTDGSSNTVMVGQITENLPAWGSPDNMRDLRLGLGAGPDRFNGYDGKTALLMADGAVRPVSDSIDISILKAIATPDGGETVPDF